MLKVLKSHELAQQRQSEFFLIACVIRKGSEESAKYAVYTEPLLLVHKVWK